MTELDELKLRVSRAKRLIADIRQDVEYCRRDLKGGATADVETGLTAIVDILNEIDSALGGDK